MRRAALLTILALAAPACEKDHPDAPATDKPDPTRVPVKVAGVTVGKVAEVKLWGGQPDPDRGNRPVQVRVRLKISPDALRMLHDDAYHAAKAAIMRPILDFEHRVAGHLSFSHRE